MDVVILIIAILAAAMFIYLWVIHSLVKLYNNLFGNPVVDQLVDQSARNAVLRDILANELPSLQAQSNRLQQRLISTQKALEGAKARIAAAAAKDEENCSKLGD